MSTNTRNQTSIYRAQNRCLRLDMYGRPVSLTFHGQEKFKTPIGSILTVTVITVLITFTLFKCLDLNNMKFPLQASVYEKSFY